MARSNGEKDRTTRAQREAAKAKAALARVSEEKVAEVAETAEEVRGKLALLVEATRGAPVGTENPLAVLPRADALVMSEMTLPNQHEYLMIYRTIAQRAIAAMAPRVVWKLARKIEDHTEPGDTRLIVETLKGLGLLEPSAPMTDIEREQKMKRHADMEKLTLDEMKARLLEGTR